MKVQDLFARLKQPPAIPQLLQEMMTSFSQEDVSLTTIAARIAMDPVVSGKVLKMANSAAYSRGREVESIEQAAIRLGLNKLRSLIIATSLTNNFSRATHFDINVFWRNSFQVAQIAKTLAIQTALPEQASLIELSQQQGNSRVEAQHEVLDFDYTDVGVELAKQWNFTNTFSNAISQQLDPLAAAKVSQEAILIRLAVFVNLATNAGVPANMIASRFPHALSRHLNIDAETLMTQLTLIEEQGNELASILLQH